MSDQTDDAARLATQLRYLQIVSVVSFEARVSDFLEREVPEFVRGTEHASIDGAVYVSNDAITSMPSTLRTFTMIDKYEEKDVFLPIGFKLIDFIANKEGMKHEVTHSKSQDCVQAFVIGSVQDPSWVAVIPHEYLCSKQSHDSNAGRRHYTTPVLDHPSSAFDMSWLPFMMPLDEISAGIRAMTDFYKGVTPHWLNPHNGVIIMEGPSPGKEQMETVRGSALFPTDHRHKTHDYGYIGKIFKAFHQHGKHFDLEVPRIKARICDILFVLKSDPDVKCVRHCSGHDGTERLIFTWQNDFDFIITGIGLTGSDDAAQISQAGYCFAQDELPIEWFHNTDQILEWKPDDENFLKARYLDFTFDQAYVEKLESILLNAPSLKSTRKIPQVDMAPNFMIDELLVDELAVDAQVQGENDVRVNEPSNSEVAITDDDAAERAHTSQREWDRCQVERLMLQCAQQKYGLVYRLRDHPAGRAVFVPWVWNDAEVDAYLNNKKSPCELYELSLGTPMIYLVFARADLCTHQSAQTTTSPIWHYTTEALAKSFWIVDLVPFKLQHIEHGQFVVPSEALDNDSMYDLVAQNMKSETFSTVGPVELAQHEALEVYATEADTAAKLRDMFHYKPDEQIKYGNVRANLRQNITPGDYIFQLIDVAQMYILTFEDPSAWFVFGC